ncbi:uncharacterized protein ACR2FA_010544 [Aphomia sociella]
MKSKRKHSSSGDEGQPECLMPLKFKITRTDTDINSLQNLCSDNIISCEFCEEVFLSRCNYLIHNASHIIIPLINLEVHQCTECLHHFTSKRDLSRHITITHGGITQTDNNNTDYKLERNLKIEIIKIESQNLKTESQTCHEESQTSYEESQTANFKSHLRILKTEPEVSDTESLLNLDSVKSENVADDYYEDVKESLTSVKSECENIKDRILFEEDLNTSQFMTDLTTDCKVAVEVFNPPWMMTLLQKRRMECMDKDQSLSLVNGDKTAVDQNDVVYESVHYDELLKDKVYVCKFCGITSRNRYRAIIHETEHMFYKRKKTYLCQYCDYHVSDTIKGLAEHINRSHSTQMYRPDHITKCRKCKLDYVHYYRHLKIYHKIYSCKVCGERFEYEVQRDAHYIECGEASRHVGQHVRERAVSKDVGQHVHEHARSEAGRHDGLHVREHADSKTVKVCDICYSFLKNRINIHYTFVGDYCKIGERLPCERCYRKCFELKIVKRIRKHLHDYNRKKLQSACKKHRKTTTNEDRLKNIRQRLKNMRINNT